MKLTHTLIKYAVKYWWQILIIIFLTGFFLGYYIACPHYLPNTGLCYRY